MTTEESLKSEIERVRKLMADGAAADQLEGKPTRFAALVGMERAIEAAEREIDAGDEPGMRAIMGVLRDIKAA